MVEPIKIDGLTEFTRNLKKLDDELPKALRMGFNKAADIVATHARAKVPRRTGKAAGSIKPRSTRTAARVIAGGRSAPYYPWLDFGGRVGRKHSVKRPFIKEGRYLWKTVGERYDEVSEAVAKALLDAARQAGVEVD